MSTFGRQRTLFDQLNEVSPERVHSRLTPIYPLLWQVVMDPWGQFQALRATDPTFRKMDEWDAAQWLTMHMRFRAQDLFAQHPSVRTKRLNNGMFVMTCFDEFAVTIKKIKRRKVGNLPPALQRSNILTPTNKRYWHDERIPLFPDLNRLILAYSLEKELTEIKIRIGYPRTRRKGFRWIEPLPYQVQGVIRMAQVDESHAEQPRRGFEVIPNADAYELGGGI
jgi:hypothetical protein